MKRRLLPAEKKRLSYERDGRNLYGENDKGSRKSIPRFKASSKRAVRRGEHLAVAAMLDGNEEGAERRLAELAFRARQPWKRKSPDLPLGLAMIVRGDAGPNAAALLHGKRRRAFVQGASRFMYYTRSVASRAGQMDDE